MAELDRTIIEEVPNGTLMDSPHGGIVGLCYDCGRPQNNLWALNGYFVCSKCLAEKGIRYARA